MQVAGGDTIEAPRGILADVSAPALYRQLVGEDHLPAWFVRSLDRFQWDHGTFKIDWALSGPIPWRAEAASRAGTVHLCDSLDRINAYAVTSLEVRFRRTRSCSWAR